MNATPPMYGPMPPPPPLPPPVQPPAQRRRGPLPLALGGGAVALLLFCGLLGVMFRPWSSGDDGANPARVQRVAADEDLAQVAAQLLVAPATRYTGWFTDEDGDRVTLDARVANEGSTSARLTVAGQAADVIATGDRTFAKAGTAFWRRHGVATESLAEYAKRWVRVPADFFGLDLGNTLAPALVAASLSPGIDGEGSATDGTRARGAPTTVDGVAVTPVQANGITFYISTAAPKRLVRVSTTAAPPSTGFRTAAYRVADGDLELSLAALDDTQRDQLFTELQQRVNQLRTSVDIAVRFSLDGQVALAPCNTNGCTATLTISNKVSSLSSYVSVKQPVNAEITITVTLDGRTVRTCVSTTSMKPNGSTKVSCPAVYSIPPSRNPKMHSVRAQASAVARALAEADVKQMAKDLADELKRNGRLGVTPPNTGHEYLPKGTSPPRLNPRQQQAKTRVDQLAKQACREVPKLPGESDRGWGSRVHARFGELIKAEPASAGLFSEVAYRHGGLTRQFLNRATNAMWWPRDTRIPDVVLGQDRLKPELFLDLKTGADGLTEKWYDELLDQVPKGYEKTPVFAVRC
jgi:hypothetical protein